MRKLLRGGRRARRSSAPARPEPSTVEVAAAVIETGGRILIAQRRADQRLPFLWEFPGGKRETGETWPECLARELREELGVESRVGSLLDAVTHSARDLTVAIRFFRCEIVSGVPRPLGCRAVQWAAPRELAAYEFPEPDAGLVAWLASGGATRRRVRVAFARDRTAIVVAAGVSLEEAAARAGASLAFGCRAGVCGSCLVSVRSAPGALSSKTPTERATLRERRATTRQRLACQARILRDVVVDYEASPFPFG